MRLQRFRLQGFAQHQDLDLVFFDEAPNLIIGPNEAGKSHLMCGLLGTLFGMSDYEPYLPWHGEPVMTGRLAFCSGNDLVEIERRFAEDHVDVMVNGEEVYRGRGRVHGRAHEDQRYRGLLRDWVGFAEPEVFERTVFVGQDLVMDEKLAQFSDQIKRLISGTREANYETAIKDLDDELDTLIKRPRKHKNRKRETLQARLTDLESRYDEAERVQGQVVQLVEEEQELNDKIRDAKATQERYGALVESYRTLQELNDAEQKSRQNWTDLEKQLNAIERTEKHRADLEQKRDQLRIPGDPEPDTLRQRSGDIDRLRTEITHLGADVQRNDKLRTDRAKLEATLEELRIPGDPGADDIRQLEWEIRQASVRIDELKHRIVEETRPPEPAHPRSTSGSMRTGLLVTAAFWALASILLGIVIDPLLLVLLVFAAIPLLIGLRSGGGSQDESAGAASDQEARQPHVERLSWELDEVQGQLGDLERKRDEYLQATGLESLEQLQQRAADREKVRIELNAKPEVDETPAQELQQKQGELQERESQRDEWLRSSGEPDLESLVKRADDYRETLRLLEQQDQVDPERKKELQERLEKAKQDTVTADLQRKTLLEEHPEIEQIPAEDIQSYRTAVDEAETAESKARDRLRELSLQRQHLGRGAEDAEALRLEIDEARAELERIEMLAEAHELAIQTLQESVQEFQENALDPVAEDAARYFGSITDGRYEGVTIDRDNMTPAVSGNGRGEIDFDRLSRGAKDQLYLSIRAALIDALSGERDLPLVLDDPCVHFDDERLSATAELIAGIARERQILLFTKDETWTRWFNPVLRLARQDASVPS